MTQADARMTVLTAAGWFKTTAGAITAVVSVAMLMIGAVVSAVRAFDDLKATADGVETMGRTVAGLVLQNERMAEDIERLTQQVAKNSTAQDALRQEVGALKDTIVAAQPDMTPPIRFASYGHAVEDGRPGQVVILKWRIEVDRTDCPPPRVLIDHTDAEGVTRSVDMVDFRPTKLPLSPPTQVIQYPIRYPSDAAEGRGTLKAVTIYTCPGMSSPLPPIVSPSIEARILPPRKDALGGVATYPEDR